MTIDGEEVPTEEFIYLYQKNLQQQTTPQTIEEYLPLFVNYRLKVAEAKSLGIDTLESFRNEMATYRRDLVQPYITDTVFFNKLVDEALERENLVVESSHIMIIRTNDKEIDERNLFVLDSIRNELLNGADFIEIAKTYSQDKFSSDKGGYLGYAPAGTYPYDFETAVYETPEGQISEIVESHVGWHLVKSGARKDASEFNRPKKNIEDVKSELAHKVSSPFDPRYKKIRKNLISNLLRKHKEIDISGLNDEEALDVLLEAEEKSQYENNPDYRNLINEYYNGSLLYEVSLENVWDKAANEKDWEDLDKAWVEKLKTRHKVDINQKEWNSIRKIFKN